ncbi:hypothetical protein ACO0K9_01035 [Undibacterium sp. Ji50W]|uniref:hypothetical protein n=1 Tax=Undibacterium sp. Ji50W TaxID=3413041 RepID=UPI003BEFC7DD
MRINQLSMDAADVAATEVRQYSTSEIVGANQSPKQYPEGEFSVYAIDPPTARARIAAACITLACGGKRVGMHPKMILMHPEVAPPPMDEERQAFFADSAQKEAAEVLFEVLMAACEVQPLLMAKIEQALARRVAWRTE